MKEVSLRKQSEDEYKQKILRTYTGVGLIEKESFYGNRPEKVLNLDPCTKFDNAIGWNLIVVCRTARIA